MDQVSSPPPETRNNISSVILKRVEIPSARSQPMQATIGDDMRALLYAWQPDGVPKGTMARSARSGRGAFTMCSLRQAGRAPNRVLTAYRSSPASRPMSRCLVGKAAMIAVTLVPSGRPQNIPAMRDAPSTWLPVICGTQSRVEITMQLRASDGCRA